MPDSGQLESGFHRESERSMRVLRSGACCLLEYGSLKVLFIGSLERAQQEQAGATRGNRFAGGRLANGALVPFVRATSGDGGIEISGVRSRCGRHGLIRHEKHAGAAGRTYGLPGRGRQQEHWRMGPNARGMGAHRTWLPWISVNHGITGMEESDPGLYPQLAKEN